MECSNPFTKDTEPVHKDTKVWHHGHTKNKRTH